MQTIQLYFSLLPHTHICLNRGLAKCLQEIRAFKLNLDTIEMIVSEVEGLFIAKFCIFFTFLIFRRKALKQAS